MKYLLTLTFLPALLLSTATMQYPIRDYTNIELNGPIRTTFKQNGTTSLFISANS
jgi:hypothetical protein